MSDSFGGAGAEYAILSHYARPDLARDAYTQALSNALDRAGSWIYDPYESQWRDSRVWEKFRNDLVYAAATEYRLRAVAGLAVQAIAPSREFGDRLGAQLTGDLLGYTPRYGGVRKMLAEADFLGEQWMVMTGSYRMVHLQHDCKPRRWWVPGKIHHVDKRRFRLVPMGHGADQKISWQMWSRKRRRWEVLRPQAREFFIRHTYEEREDGLGYARGLLASLYPWWKAKTLVMEQGLEACERFCQGIVNAQIDGMRLGSPDRTNIDQIEKWMAVLKAMTSRNYLIHDKDEEWSVEWPNQGIVDIPLRWAEYFDSAGLRLIQASDLTTGQGDSGQGSYAQAQSQRSSMSDYFAPDRARLAETLEGSQLSLLWQRNRQPMLEALRDHGCTVARRPSLGIDTAERSTPKEAIEVIKGMQETGMDVDREWAYEQVGAPVPADGDDVLEAPQQDQGGGFPGFGGGGFPGGGGGGSFPGHDFDEEDEDEPGAVGDDPERELEGEEGDARMAARLEAGPGEKWISLGPEGNKRPVLISEEDGMILSGPHAGKPVSSYGDSWETAREEQQRELPEVDAAEDFGELPELEGPNKQAETPGQAAASVPEQPVMTSEELLRAFRNGERVPTNRIVNAVARAGGVDPSNIRRPLPFPTDPDLDRVAEIGQRLASGEGLTDEQRRELSRERESHLVAARILAKKAEFQTDEQRVAAAITGFSRKLMETSKDASMQIGAAMSHAVRAGARTTGEAIGWAANKLGGMTTTALRAAMATAPNVVLGMIRMASPLLIGGALMATSYSGLVGMEYLISTMGELQGGVTGALMMASPAIVGTLGVMKTIHGLKTNQPGEEAYDPIHFRFLKWAGLGGAKQIARGFSQGWEALTDEGDAREQFERKKQAKAQRRRPRRSARLEAGEDCKPGERSDLTGCRPSAPGKGASKRQRKKAAKAEVAAARASVAHDVLEELGIEPGQELDRKAYGKALDELTNNGVSAKQAGKILDLYRDPMSSAGPIARQLEKAKATLGEKAKPLAKPLIAAGYPPNVATAIASLAAVDATLPITFTSMALTAVLGPVAAAKIPIYWTPGAAEAGAIVGAAVAGKKAADAMVAITKRLAGRTA